MDKKIIGIMAVSPNGAVGLDGELPWNYPSENKFFQDSTKNHIVIMGRKSFDSMPKNLLDERVAIVFTKNQTFIETLYSNCIVVKSIEEFLLLLKSNFITKKVSLKDNTKIFMIGGAELAHVFLAKKLISEFLLTIIKKNYPGDCFFNLALLDDWTKEVIFTSPDYTIYKALPNYKTEV